MALWKWVLTIGLLAVAGYFALPGAAAKDFGYSMIGVASVVCVLIGLHIHQPRDRRCWQFIAAGNLCFVLGDAVFDIYQFVLHQPVPLPSVADVLYLAGYPFIFRGVTRLTQVQGHPAAREDYADAAIISIGALALSWHFLMGSDANNATMDTLGKLVTLAYPVMDIAILFVVIRGLMFGIAWRPVHRLLAGSLFSMLVGDFIYDVLTQHGSYSTGNPVDAGWLIGYVLVASGALHPSVADLLDESSRPSALDQRRLPLVALAGLVSPTILLVSTLLAKPVDVAVLAVLSIALFGLVVARMWWLFSRLARQAHDLVAALSGQGALEAELRHQAFHDALTGLANRALLHDRVERALAASPRVEGVVALCFCDLDGFKTINDSLGHGVGDEVLTAVAKRLTSIVRPGDTVARLGGDEFAVLMENVEHPDIAATIAQRIVSAVREPIELDGRRIDLSASVGLAIAGPLMTTEQLLSEADSAMYAAKTAGKNCYEIFEQWMLDRVVEELTLKSAFVDAISRSEFYLQYQPQFSLRDGRLEGFETFLHWHHPTFGVIASERFISVAERSGHILPIGRWVLETACEQAAAWSSRTQKKLRMAVKIYDKQLQDPQFLDDVKTALAISGLEPNQLVLEISETSLLLDTALTSRVRTDLKAIGVFFTIDDFGMGYSSLRHLREFPVDFLKINKSYIDPLDEATGDAAVLVRLIVSLAHTLGLLAVAEGVERSEQRDLLRGFGCDIVQGNLLAPPLDAEAAAALISAKEGLFAGTDPGFARP
jgi:diguanylate cyclase (GGDEF)-like protein